jgi:hypothetical protein
MPYSDIPQSEDKVKNLNKYINAVMAFLDNIADKISNIGFLNINPGKKTLAIVFTAAVVLIAMVSGVFVIGEVISDEPTTVVDETGTTEPAVSFVADSQNLQGNFLIALTYEDKIELLGVVRVNSAEKNMRVSFLSGDTYCSFNNLKGTMNEHYKKGGITELVWAVGEYAGISIERYIIADQRSFSALLEHIGEMTVNLEHQVICGQDAASFIIEEGQQTLIPNMMAKYFYYICEGAEKYQEEIIDVMALYAKSLFCNGDEDKAERNFSYMISCIETNISALDFNNYKSAILSVATTDILDNMTVEEDLSSFR